MQIIDKYGYLESALGYIEKGIASGRGLQRIAKKASINEDFVRDLSLSLEDFSEKQFFTVLQEKLESTHSSLSGAEVEIVVADVGIEMYKKKAFVSINLVCDIMIDGEKEDKIDIDVKIFSRNNIQIGI